MKKRHDGNREVQAAAGSQPGTKEILARIPTWDEFWELHSDRLERIGDQPGYEAYIRHEMAEFADLQRKHPDVLCSSTFRHLNAKRARRGVDTYGEAPRPPLPPLFPREWIDNLYELRKAIEGDPEGGGSQQASMCALVAHEHLKEMLCALDEGFPVIACARAARCGHSIAEGWAMLHHAQTVAELRRQEMSKQTRLEVGQRYLDWHERVVAALAGQGFGRNRAAQEARDMLIPIYQIEQGTTVDGKGSWGDMTSRWRRQRKTGK